MRHFSTPVFIDWEGARGRNGKVGEKRVGYHLTGHLPQPSESDKQEFERAVRAFNPWTINVLE